MEDEKSEMLLKVANYYREGLLTYSEFHEKMDLVS